MKKVLAIIALLCSLGLGTLVSVSANVYAIDTTVNVGGTDLEYDPDFDEDIYEEDDEWEDEIVD